MHRKRGSAGYTLINKCVYLVGLRKAENFIVVFFLNVIYINELKMMDKSMLGLLLLAAMSLSSFQSPVPPLKFQKQLIATESAESAGVFDVNGDGIPDIVSGSFWYEGPEFK